METNYFNEEYEYEWITLYRSQSENGFRLVLFCNDRGKPHINILDDNNNLIGRVKLSRKIPKTIKDIRVYDCNKQISQEIKQEILEWGTQLTIISKISEWLSALDWYYLYQKVSPKKNLIKRTIVCRPSDGYDFYLTIYDHDVSHEDCPPNMRLFNMPDLEIGSILITPKIPRKIEDIKSFPGEQEIPDEYKVKVVEWASKSNKNNVNNWLNAMRQWRKYKKEFEQEIAKWKLRMNK